MSTAAQLKQKLAHGGTVLGSWLTLGSPAAAEILARAGFDFLIIDGEHSAAGLDTVQMLLQAMQGTDTVPILRVPANDRAVIKVALDIGVQGVMVPMVNSREEALAAVQACKYPPAGVRGIGPGRACGYGKDLREYLNRANDDMLVFLIAEHHQAVANITDIAAVPGVDAIFFGYYDFAASLGLHGNLEHPAVLAAQAAVLQATQAAGTAAAYAAWTPHQARELMKTGFRVITIGGDAPFLIGGSRSVLDALRI